MRRLDAIIDLMNMNLSKLWEIVKDREAWHVQSMGSQRVRHDWVSELNWYIVLVVYVYKSKFPNLSHPPAPFTVGVYMFDLYVCVSISALQMRGSVPFSRIYIIWVNIQYLLFCLTYFTLYDSPSTSAWIDNLPLHFSLQYFPASAHLWIILMYFRVHCTGVWFHKITELCQKQKHQKFYRHYPGMIFTVLGISMEN